MPNVKPAWLTIIIFSVQNLWNTNAATVIYSEEKKTLAGEIAEFATRESVKIPELLTNPSTLMIAAAVLAGVIVWSIIHEAFVRPFVLAGVLKNYLQSGMDDVPTEASFAALDSRSAKFAKLHGELA